MYQMMKSLGVKAAVRQELPAGLVAFLIAEFFYKFHSFALETLAFLATWWLLSWVERVLMRALKPGNGEHAGKAT